MTPPTQSQKKINVAITGGGIGGLCCAIGLLKYEHLNVQIYEAAHHFAEIGAGIAFAPNSLRAVKAISPECGVAFDRIMTSNTYPSWAHVFNRYYFGQGEHAGEEIATIKNETGQQSLHRAKLLDELVKIIPPEMAHFGKRLVDIEQNATSGVVTLKFKDGTTATADCVIGADGIHSVTRELIRGSNHPELDVQFTGSRVYRGLVPMEVAVAAIGDEKARNGCIHAGYGRATTAYPVEGGSILNVAVIDLSKKTWEGPQVKKANYAELEEMFKDWHPDVKALIKLLDKPETMEWSIWDLPKQPTYFKDRVVMMGDAAHASSPYQGQGAGQATEDALVLSTVLGRVHDVADIPAAFEAYSKIRLPRSQHVVELSREAGELISLRLPGVMDDREKLRENLAWRLDWVWNRDIDGEVRQANLIFDELVAERTGRSPSP